MNHIVLDIETGRAPQEDLDYRIMQLSPPKSISGKTAQEKWLTEQRQKIEAKANLYDTSPIEVIGLMINTQVVILTTIETPDIPNITVKMFPDEQSMLKAFLLLTNGYEPEDTIVITQNGLGFDIPRIRCRCGFYQLPQPSIFDCQQYDTMKQFSYNFSNEQKAGYVSLRHIARALGVGNGKEVTWSQALRDGPPEQYIMYNVNDLLLTYECFQRMI
jgi:DNA polymerase elongation subunit (family B)